MKRYFSQSLIVFLFISVSGLSASFPLPGDSTVDDQILINGRLWHNRITGIKGDPFFFTNGFMPGSVSINNRTYSNLQVRYDIFTDEIMVPVAHGILQLNKELIDSFSIKYPDKTFRFIRIPVNSSGPLSGYVHNIYTGKSALYIKYQKKIDRPGMVNETDRYYQIRRIYYVNDSRVYLVKNKGDLYRIFKEDKAQIKTYLKRNKVHVKNNNPESYSPIIQYRDSIRL